MYILELSQKGMVNLTDLEFIQTFERYEDLQKNEF